MPLPTIWFAAIAFLWLGYLVLDGFDFGVGVLLPVLGRTDPDRRVLLATIGPVWDGNEVWIIVAAGATFAAFPDWYATLFSASYLPLLAILLALIGRGVALEYRDKRDHPRWRTGWDVALCAGSLLPALGWGLILAATTHGLPLDAHHDTTAGPAALFGPYPLLGALTIGALCTTHGATFLALKTRGRPHHRARRAAGLLGALTLPPTAAFLAWTLLLSGRPTAHPLALAAAPAALLGLAGGLLATRLRRDGWAFAGTAAALGLTVVTLFTARYPQVLPSTGDPAGGLTVSNAAASPYTLQIMTWAALLFLPLVLAYQAWTYWVFRRRLGRTDPANGPTADPAADPARPAPAR